MRGRKREPYIVVVQLQRFCPRFVYSRHDTERSGYFVGLFDKYREALRPSPNAYLLGLERRSLDSR